MFCVSVRVHVQQDTSKGGKTGRFGIGFNSCYHLGELPSFVSADRWCSFDPQAKFLPAVDPSNPGKSLNFLKNPHIVAQYRDQFEPFRAFGNDFSKAFQGTLFRFPLRTAQQAAVSRLSRQTYTADSTRELLQLFVQESCGMLLFLKVRMYSATAAVFVRDCLLPFNVSSALYVVLELNPCGCSALMRSFVS
jgi:sacsin